MASSSPKKENLPSSNDLEHAVEWLRDKGLLITSRPCDVCPSHLKIKESFPLDNFDIWDCVNSKCVIPNKTIKTTEGSFFTQVGNVLNLAVWIHLLKYWCEKVQCSKILDLLKLSSDSPVDDAFKMCRKFCTGYFQRYPVKLGGENRVIIVKTYESIKGERLLIMIERDNHLGYMQLIQKNLDSSTKLSIIEDVLEPGSIIATDEWGSSSKLDSKFQIINCSSAENEVLGSYISNCKEMVSKTSSPRIQLNREDYISEFMWRERNCNKPFEKFIEHLKDYYNPDPLN